MASEAGAACPLAPQFYRHFAASRARSARKVPAPGSVSFRDYLALHPRRGPLESVTQRHFGFPAQFPARELVAQDVTGTS